MFIIHCRYSEDGDVSPRSEDFTVFTVERWENITEEAKKHKNHDITENHIFYESEANGDGLDEGGYYSYDKKHLRE